MSGSYAPLNLYSSSDGIIQPTIPVIGQTWTERDASGNVVGKWFWNGTYWLSEELFRATIGSLSSGQVIVVSAVMGLLTRDSLDAPLNTGNVYSIYITRIDAGFTINTGNLTGSNYWRLVLKDNNSVVQTLNITSGNNNETTGEIRKSSANINTAYLHNRRLSVQMQKIGGLAPDIYSPTATVEYRLVR